MDNTGKCTLGDCFCDSTTCRSCPIWQRFYLDIGPVRGREDYPNEKINGNNRPLLQLVVSNGSIKKGRR